MRWGVGGKEELQGRVWMGEDGGKGMFMGGSDDLEFLEMNVHVQCAWRKVLVNVTILCYGCKQRWHVDSYMSQRLHVCFLILYDYLEPFSAPSSHPDSTECRISICKCSTLSGGL